VNEGDGDRVDVDIYSIADLEFLCNAVSVGRGIILFHLVLVDLLFFMVDLLFFFFLDNL
jgi:hypothetical protein